MSSIYINYMSLESSITYAQNASKEITNYVEELKRKITTPISNLDGSDSQGYASTATSMAWKKVNELTEKTLGLSRFESSVSTLVRDAKTYDQNVSNKISEITNNYVGKRKWYQAIGDTLYNFFCVDLVNSNELARLFADGVKWVMDKGGNVLEKAVNCFKYGDGKYVWNIISAITSVITAVAGVIVAIVSIPFTGGMSTPAAIAAIISLVGLVASTVSMFITMANAESEILGNIKAMKVKDGSPSAARYYGNIDSKSEEWKRTDMGSQETNDFYEGAGKAIDFTKAAADTVSFACNILNLGFVKDFRYKPTSQGHYKDYDFGWQNIKRNIMHDMGYGYNGKLKEKNVLKGWYDNFIEDNYAKKFKFIDGEYAISEKAIQFLRSIKILDNTMDTMENIDSVISGIKQPAFDKIDDIVKGIVDVLGFSDVVSKPVDVPKDGYNLINDYIDLFTTKSVVIEGSGRF